jgi:hypothetical protein
LNRWKPEQDFMVMIYGKPIPPHTVRVSKVATNVVEIDVEQAWKEMGLHAQWSNEVRVETFVGAP